jgi:hypothetical protein
MLKQVQGKGIQVTSIGSRDGFDPIILFDSYAEVHDPEIGKACRDHQAYQSRWIQDVAPVQVEYFRFQIAWRL